jgi:LacI family transcriptional regulator
MAPIELPPPLTGRTVTLKQIAAHLNLSVTTVARALRGGERLGAETVARVRAAANDLGYVRNLDGLRLRTGRTHTILALLGTADDGEVGDPSASGLMTGMQRRLAETGYTVQNIAISIDDRSPAQLSRLLAGNRTDGLILDHIEPDDPRIALLERIGQPFVAFGRSSPDATHAYFEIDNVHAAQIGTASLIARGFRRPALVEASPDFNFACDRMAGYRAALAEAGLPYDPALVLHCPADAAAIRQATRALALTQRPDSWVCSNEIFLFGTLSGARDAGQSLEKTGFHLRAASNIGAYLGVPLTTAHYPRDQVGWHLADLILQRIEGTPARSLQRMERTELRSY